uniref:U6 snRNA phosphodiesterase 1 isoform X1 n=2 Tax=Myxine glutinosa TaxID=7769 RepID=UPI00358EF3FB
MALGLVCYSSSEDEDGDGDLGPGVAMTTMGDCRAYFCCENLHSSEDGQPRTPPKKQAKLEQRSASPQQDRTSKRMSWKNDQGDLPLPASVLAMFPEVEKGPADDPGLHEGRVRSFAHERGNWATHVHLSCAGGEDLNEFVDRLLDVTATLGHFSRQDGFHVSLSHTVVLRHHWIAPFVESLRELLHSFSRFSFVANKVNIYTNEERTRTFLGLAVTGGNNQLENLVTEVNEALHEFRLPSFYEEPSFHVTLAWCIGDLSASFDDSMKNKLQALIDDFQDISEVFHFKVECVMCKVGNKHFTVPLH